MCEPAFDLQHDPLQGIQARPIRTAPAPILTASHFLTGTLASSLTDASPGGHA
jgi:hypothetical protein